MLTDQQLDDTFAALAHPMRRSILARLAKGGATVNELAAPFDVSLPAVSRHLKVLERSGLIRRGKDAQFRPCELNAEPLREVVSWAQQYRPIWEARFDQLETCLEALAGDENGD